MLCGLLSCYDDNFLNISYMWLKCLFEGLLFVYMIDMLLVSYDVMIIDCLKYTSAWAICKNIYNWFSVHFVSCQLFKICHYRCVSIILCLCWCSCVLGCCLPSLMHSKSTIQLQVYCNISLQIWLHHRVNDNVQIFLGVYTYQWTDAGNNS